MTSTIENYLEMFINDNSGVIMCKEFDFSKLPRAAKNYRLVSKALEKIPNIEILTLDGQYDDIDIPKTVKKLTIVGDSKRRFTKNHNLTELSIEGHIQSFRDLIANFPNLEKLSCQAVISFDNEIPFTKLKTLEMTRGSNEKTSKIFGSVPDIQHLAVNSMFFDIDEKFPDNALTSLELNEVDNESQVNLNEKFPHLTDLRYNYLRSYKKNIIANVKNLSTNGPLENFSCENLRWERAWYYSDDIGYVFVPDTCGTQSVTFSKVRWINVEFESDLKSRHINFRDCEALTVNFEDLDCKKITVEDCTGEFPLDCVFTGANELNCVVRYSEFMDEEVRKYSGPTMYNPGKSVTVCKKTINRNYFHGNYPNENTFIFENCNIYCIRNSKNFENKTVIFENCTFHSKKFLEQMPSTSFKFVKTEYSDDDEDEDSDNDRNDDREFEDDE